MVKKISKIKGLMALAIALGLISAQPSYAEIYMQLDGSPIPGGTFCSSGGYVKVEDEETGFSYYYPYSGFGWSATSIDDAIKCTSLTVQIGELDTKIAAAEANLSGFDGSIVSCADGYLKDGAADALAKLNVQKDLVDTYKDRIDTCGLTYGTYTVGGSWWEDPTTVTGVHTTATGDTANENACNSLETDYQSLLNGFNSEIAGVDSQVDDLKDIFSGDALANIGNDISTKLDDLTTGLASNIDTTLSDVQSDFTGDIDGARAQALADAEAITGPYTAQLDAAKADLQATLDEIEDLQNMPQRTLDSIEKLLRSVMKAQILQLNEFLHNPQSIFAPNFEQRFDNAMDVFKQTVETIKNLLRINANNAIATVTSAIDTVKDIYNQATAFVANAEENLATATDQLTAIATNTADAVADAATATVDKLEAEATAIASQIEAEAGALMALDAESVIGGVTTEAEGLWAEAEIALDVMTEKVAEADLAALDLPDAETMLTSAQTAFTDATDDVTAKVTEEAAALSDKIAAETASITADGLLVSAQTTLDDAQTDLTAAIAGGVTSTITSAQTAFDNAETSFTTTETTATTAASSLTTAEGLLATATSLLATSESNLLTSEVNLSSAETTATSLLATIAIGDAATLEAEVKSALAITKADEVSVLQSTIDNAETLATTAFNDAEAAAQAVLNLDAADYLAAVALEDLNTAELTQAVAGTTLESALAEQVAAKDAVDATYSDAEMAADSVAGAAKTVTDLNAIKSSLSATGDAALASLDDVKDQINKQIVLGGDTSTAIDSLSTKVEDEASTVDFCAY